jgi:hypothetical protein
MICSVLDEGEHSRNASLLAVRCALLAVQQWQWAIGDRQEEGNKGRNGEGQAQEDGAMGNGL